MNVYDFDGTIYHGNSTADFVRWCARRHPRILQTLPYTALTAIVCFGLGAINKTHFKRVLYRFLHYIPDINHEVECFWIAREKRISGPCKPQSGDLIISASPEFLLHNICAKRGFELIASQVDPHTGQLHSRNCSDEEKVVRFRERYGFTPIERFFSDSRSDDPLAALAHEAWLVDMTAKTLQAWPWQN